MRACVGLALVGLMVSSQGACSSSKSNGGSSDGGASAQVPPYDMGLDGGSLAPLAQIAIIEMAGFQGTKAQIITTTPIGPQPITPTPLQHPMPANAPVVALRTGQIRLYIDPTNGGNTDWTPHVLSAELDVFDSSGNPLVPPMGTATHVDEKMITGISNDGDLSTTFNFLMEPQDLPEGAQFTVTVRDKTLAAGVDSDPTTGAIYPTPGNGNNGANYADMNVVSSGQVGFQYQYVPIQYEVDGSGRLPETSTAQLDGLSNELNSLYPVDQITSTVHANYPWTTADGVIDASGNGWDNVLMEMEVLRQTDHTPANVWLVAAFEPSDNFDDYCAEGCVLGLGTIGDDVHPTLRVAAIVGYRGGVASDTLPQELAHTMGELHAPCPYPGEANAAAPGSFENAWPSGLTRGGPLESAFPTYANARIGQWGYDINTRALLNPTDPETTGVKYREFMSYCFSPTYTIWTSDYTFNKLFNAIKFINNSVTSSLVEPAPTPAAPKPYHFIKVGRDGVLRWGVPIMMSEEPGGFPYPVSYVAADGHTMATGPGSYFPLDIGGGLLLVPEAPSGFAEVRLDGMTGLKSNRLAAEKK